MKTNRFPLFPWLLSAAVTLFLALPLAAQKTDQPDKQPEFPGGTTALINFLVQNIRYPEAAKKEKAEGIVFAQFDVDKDGTISNIQTISSNGQIPRADLAKETLRVIKLMPKWIPAEAGGKRVKSEMVLPVRYKLDEEKKP